MVSRIAVVLGLLAIVFPIAATGAGSATSTNAGIVWANASGIYGADADGRDVGLIVSSRGTDFHTSPAWSPNGRVLVYSACASDSCDLEVLPPGSGTPRLVRVRPKYPRDRLTQFLTQASWAPDGARVAVHDGWGTGVSIVQIVLLESGRARPLTTASGSRWDGAPAWSPDGRLIAFVRRSHRFAGVTLHGPPSIYVVRPNGAGLRRLTSGHNPSWSPDGRRLVLSWGSGIYRVDVDGGNRVRIARVPGTRGELLEPSWSPDGHKILYAVNEERGRSIWVMDTDGTDREQLVFVRSSDPPSYTVDGLGWRPG